MGVQVYIKLKDGINPEKINEFLKKNKVSQFTTEEDNICWLNDINTNPKSPQSHLKPADRDLTMDELKKMFTIWTTPNLLQFDVGFSRTSQEEIDAYCSMTHDNADNIEYIDGAKDVLERFDISPDVKPILERLNKVKEEPKKLPKDKQHHPDLQGGLFLCKSFSIKPFWVVFGNVETPKFLKTKIYEEDIYNNIYHDKQGYAYLLIPLLKLDYRQAEQVRDTYEYAWGMGLREDFNLLIPLVYHMGLSDYDGAADSFIDTYNAEGELLDKFKTVFKHISYAHPYSHTATNGFRFHRRFKANIAVDTVNNMLGVLTALLRAVIKKHGAEKAAEVMSELTGEHILPIEVK